MAVVAHRAELGVVRCLLYSVVLVRRGRDPEVVIQLSIPMVLYHFCSRVKLQWVEG